MLPEIPQTEYVKTRQNAKKKFEKNGRTLYSSRSLEYAECGYFTMLFCDLLYTTTKKWTHTYTAIVLVAVAVK